MSEGWSPRKVRTYRIPGTGEDVVEMTTSHPIHGTLNAECAMLRRAKIDDYHAERRRAFASCVKRMDEMIALLEAKYA